MITTSNIQTGSAHLAIIAVLTTALIAALGFIFWKNIVEPNDDTSSKVQSTQASTTPSPSVKPAADANTVTLADWKVQFTIPDSLKTTSVEYAQQSADYGFTTARIKELGGDCKTEPYGKSIVLSRSKSAPTGMDGYTLINSAPINDYYYTYRVTIPACSGSMTDPTAKVSEIEINDTENLGNLLKTLKAVQ